MKVLVDFLMNLAESMMVLADLMMIFVEFFENFFSNSDNLSSNISPIFLFHSSKSQPSHVLSLLPPLSPLSLHFDS
jgi:hypothetical protein